MPSCSENFRTAHVTPKGLLLLSATGLLNFLASASMFTALGLDRVSIVSPLVNCYSVFVLPLAFLLLRDIEQISARKGSALRCWSFSGFC